MEEMTKKGFEALAIQLRHVISSEALGVLHMVIRHYLMDNDVKTELAKYRQVMVSNRKIDSDFWAQVFQLKKYEPGVLPHLCCEAIPQQDFNPMLFPISVQV